MPEGDGRDISEWRRHRAIRPVTRLARSRNRSGVLHEKRAKTSFYDDRTYGMGSKRRAWSMTAGKPCQRRGFDPFRQRPDVGGTVDAGPGNGDLPVCRAGMIAVSSRTGAVRSPVLTGPRISTAGAKAGSRDGAGTAKSRQGGAYDDPSYVFGHGRSAGGRHHVGISAQ